MTTGLGYATIIVGNSHNTCYGGKTMDLFYAIYGMIRGFILAYEPNAADEFAWLDAVVGYEE